MLLLSLGFPDPRGKREVARNFSSCCARMGRNLQSDKLDATCFPCRCQIECFCRGNLARSCSCWFATSIGGTLAKQMHVGRIVHVLPSVCSILQLLSNTFQKQGATANGRMSFLQGRCSKAFMNIMCIWTYMCVYVHSRTCLYLKTCVYILGIMYLLCLHIRGTLNIHSRFTTHAGVWVNFCVRNALCVCGLVCIWMYEGACVQLLCWACWCMITVLHLLTWEQLVVLRKRIVMPLSTIAWFGAALTKTICTRIGFLFPKAPCCTTKIKLNYLQWCMSVRARKAGPNLHSQLETSHWLFICNEFCAE